MKCSDKKLISSCCIPQKQPIFSRIDENDCVFDEYGNFVKLKAKYAYKLPPTKDEPIGE